MAIAPEHWARASDSWARPCSRSAPAPPARLRSAASFRRLRLFLGMAMGVERAVLHRLGHEPVESAADDVEYRREDKTEQRHADHPERHRGAHRLAHLGAG